MIRMLTIALTICAALFVADDARAVVIDVSTLDDTLDYDASDTWGVNTAELNPISVVWELLNDTAVDYELTIDALLGTGLEAQNLGFFLSDDEGGAGSVLVSLFSGNFLPADNTVEPGLINVASVIIPADTTYSMIISADQIKGGAEFTLAAAPAVPVPAALPLLGAGLGLLGLVARRRKAA